MIFIRRMLRHMIVRINSGAVDREVRAPFEWTILFRNRENPKENMWMKMEREQTQIPQWVQVDPKRILLLEE